MHAFLCDSLFFGSLLTIAAYALGMLIKRKLKLAIFNPLLIATLCIIGFLSVTKVNYETYQKGSQLISYLLTPATVCLAVPLYEQLSILKKHPKAILLGLLSGVLSAMVCIWGLSALFGLTHEQYATLLPKSITAAIGMGLSKELGGIVSLTIVSILVTGIVGVITAKALFQLLHIHEPLAKGLAMGTSCHAIGTTKAMEMGEVEGAMSSLAIVGAGLLTVVAAPFFSQLL
ncbi:MAG: LrgB family protein [Clostridia bacterium]